MKFCSRNTNQRQVAVRPHGPWRRMLGNIRMKNWNFDQQTNESKTNKTTEDGHQEGAENWSWTAWWKLRREQHVENSEKKARKWKIEWRQRQTGKMKKKWNEPKTEEIIITAIHTRIYYRDISRLNTRAHAHANTNKQMQTSKHAKQSKIPVQWRYTSLKMQYAIQR